MTCDSEKFFISSNPETMFRKNLYGGDNMCPRCGNELVGGVCEKCGFPITARFGYVFLRSKKQGGKTL